MIVTKMLSVPTQLGPLTARVTQDIKAMEQTVMILMNVLSTLIIVTLMLHAIIPRVLSRAHVMTDTKEQELTARVGT